MSSSASSPVSPTSWIQQQSSVVASSNKRVAVEPLNLWPSTSTWAAYSSALASLSLGQMNEMSNVTSKYPSRCSPLTPTTPTYSPSFSPQSSVTNNFTNHPLLQPDSPHSVTDTSPDFSTAFPLDFCTTNNAGDRSPSSINANKRQLVQPEPLAANQKRSKSFTIDAILGLEEFAASCFESADAAKYFSSQEHRRSGSPGCQQQQMSPSDSPQSSPPSMLMSCASSLPASSSSPRAKRVRTIFSAEQLERLEAEFARQQYMVGPERLVLAASLRLSESQVKVWFQNRRIKWRKQHLESQQMRLVTWRQFEDQPHLSQDQLLAHHHLRSANAADDDQSESFSD
ncbi:hypothetical protein GHT06_010384 [Daphnia sinensis]|uniref:Homeobox domain-containing protein n=1 Tax=Daphnia sinensis TaxID=1820382 RepID=A0AAD5LIH9_9CRUS|nr:hypothetical protein GHT06_010384 [Daphnia sinensis]